MNALQHAMALIWAMRSRLRNLERRLIEDPLCPETHLPTLLEDPCDWLEQRLDQDIESLRQGLTAFLDASFTTLTELEDRLTPAERDFLRRYHQALVQPYFLTCGLIRRAMDTSSGCAGDHGVVEMIFEESPRGSSPLAGLLSRYILDSPIGRGHRNRMPWFHRYLWASLETGDRPPAVLSFACGPERVLREFLAAGGDCRMTLVDADAEALHFSREKVLEVSRRRGLEAAVRTVCLPAGDLVREAETARQEVIEGAPGGFDLLLVPWLLDCLPTETIDALMDQLAGLLRPGGLFLAAASHARSRWRACQDYLTGWPVFYRGMQEFCELLIGRPSRLALVELSTDPTDTTIFFAGERPTG